MNAETTLKKVLQSDELPTLPTVASELITLTSREDTTLADIADLVSKDISLSAKILKVSNSAFYSFPQQIGSIHQAVSILGTNAVRSLVLSFSFLSIDSGKKLSNFNFKQFWQKSLALAVSSKLILEKVEGADTEEIFISGLLQNLGELIFARTFPDDFDQVLEKGSEEKETLQIEEEILGSNHCHIGFEVAKHWGFPEILLLPILHHHNPTSYSGKDKKVKDTIYAVALSDILVQILFSDNPEIHHKKFRKEAKKLLQLTPPQIEDILENVHREVESAGNYFGLKIKSSKSIQEILQEANIRLSLLNLDYDQMNKQLIQAKIELENLTRELEEKNKFLDNLAHVDGLTEVYNHRYFQNTLDQEINRAQRKDTTISLILTDIDHFKSVNDTYSHQTGDFILKEFCKLLSSCLREYDTLARYGGEEFVIILPETDENEAFTVAEKLRQSVEDCSFDDGSREYKITSSFGISSGRPATEDTFSKNDLINQADLALYTSKEQGRNQSTVYSPKKKWYKF